MGLLQDRPELLEIRLQFLFIKDYRVAEVLIVVENCLWKQELRFLKYKVPVAMIRITGIRMIFPEKPVLTFFYYKLVPNRISRPALQIKGA